MKITLKVTKTTLAVFAIVMFSAGLVMISRAFTKGDLMVATDSSNLTRLSVGTDGQFLKADSTATSGVSWASVPAAVAKYEISDGSVKALWHLDTLNDSAGSANFTPSGSPTQVTGKFRSLTYHFSSGSSQYLKVTSVPISGTSTLTIHGWFKPDSNSNKGRIVMVGRDGINGYGISQGATNDSTNGDNFLHVNDGIAWHQSGGTWGNTASNMCQAVFPHVPPLWCQAIPSLT